jgi:hypothetical protein
VSWIATGYEDFEAPAWFAFVLLVVLFGGGWSLGVGLGFFLRERVFRRINIHG